MGKRRVKRACGIIDSSIDEKSRKKIRIGGAIKVKGNLVKSIGKG